MNKATITHKAKSFIIRAKNHVVGVITEPCAATNYRYRIEVDGCRRIAPSLPDAVLVFDDMTNYAYNFS